MTINSMFWLDLETTGLEAATNEILEVGCMITDQWGEEVDSYHRTVRHDPKMYNWNMATDLEVKQMHAKSGLFQEVINSGGGKLLSEVTTELAEFLLDYKINRHPMCGSSVQFDRLFLKEKAPTLESWFHYRNIDLSSFTETMKLVAPELHARMAVEVPKRLEHRVIPDLQDTIAGYRWMLENWVNVEV
jgi:oligoribonuclease